MGSDSEMPRLRRFGNTLFAWMLGLLSDRQVGDTASGMRVIRRSALEHLYPLPDGLHFTPAMSARALLEGRLKLIEVPIPYAERVGQSKLSVVRDGWRFLVTIVRAAMCYRPSPPLLMGAGAIGTLGLLVAATPAWLWVRDGYFEEWMIYRILLASLLITVAAFTVCVAVVADRIIEVAQRREVAGRPIALSLRRLFHAPLRWVAPGIVVLVAVSLVWPGVQEYLTTGLVSMHWSRSVLSSLLIVLAAMLSLTSLLLEMMELIVAQRAVDAPLAPPDRVHLRHGERAGSVAAQFDQFADSYDSDCMRGLAATGESRAYFAAGRAHHLAQWWRANQPHPATTIIDYGCGTGEGTLALALAFPNAHIVGVDVSLASIERARSHPRNEQVTFSHLADGDLQLRSADLVHVNGVLHHVPPPERDGVLGSLYRSLRSGGIVAVFENNPLNPGTRWVMSRIPFDRDAIPLYPSETARRLRTVGWHLEHRAFLFWFPRALAALRPLERYLERVPLGAQYAVFASKP